MSILANFSQAICAFSISALVLSFGHFATAPATAQPSPHFSDEREGLRQRLILSYEFSEAGDEWPQAGLGHVGYQLVEHAALAEQRMGSAFGGVDLEMTIHA